MMKTRTAGTPPNIVFLMADDHQAMALGCMGNRDIETPNLDALAAGGLVFDNAYATSPLCMPSRASVFTGLHEYRHGVNFRPTGNHPTAPMAEQTWRQYSYAARLRAAGYRTAFAGKWGFPLDVPEYSAEFDAWGGYRGHAQGSYETARNPAMARYAERYPHETRSLAAFGCDFIRESTAAGQPFCLSLSFKAPHGPHNQIDPEDLDRYRGRRFTKRPNWGREMAERLPWQARLGRQYYLFREWCDQVFDAHTRAYYQLISGIDAAVGMLRRELAEQGVADRTVVVYTSDNGYYCGSHGLGGKVLPHEESARIPLLVLDPRAGAAGRGQRCRRVVATLDYAPTILEWAGLHPEADTDGCSMAPLLEQPETPWRASLPLVYNWGWAENDHNRGMAVVTEDYKYIYWCYGDENMEPAEELYALRQDPCELHNLVSHPDHQAALEALRRRYDEHHQDLCRDCTGGEDYQRLKQLFDRRISWREKAYRGFRFAEDISPRTHCFPYTEGRSDIACVELERLYREVTGLKPPDSGGSAKASV